MGDIIKFRSGKKIDASPELLADYTYEESGEPLKVVYLLKKWNGIGLQVDELEELKMELEYYLQEVVDSIQNDFS